MDATDPADAPQVPAIIDEAELIGLTPSETPVIEAEPLEDLDPPLDTAEQQGLLLDNQNPSSREAGSSVPIPARPNLQRGQSIPSPAPLHLPPPAPPAPPPDFTQQPDSLSLGQLR